MIQFQLYTSFSPIFGFPYSFSVGIFLTFSSICCHFCAWYCLPKPTFISLLIIIWSLQSCGSLFISSCLTIFLSVSLDPPRFLSFFFLWGTKYSSFTLILEEPTGCTLISLEKGRLLFVLSSCLEKVFYSISILLLTFFFFAFVELAKSASLRYLYCVVNDSYKMATFLKNIVKRDFAVNFYIHILKNDSCSCEWVVRSGVKKQKKNKKNRKE